MNPDNDSPEEINLGVQALKKLLYYLLVIVLGLSAALNFFILESNRQLRKQLADSSYENSQLRYERNLMDAFVGEIEAYARQDHEVEKILSKYRMTPRNRGEASEAETAGQALP